MWGNCQTVSPSDQFVLNLSILNQVVCAKLLAPRLDMKKAAEKYSTFQQDWCCMFTRIIGQLGPMMVQQLQQSKAWEELERDSDPAELMKLIQKVCVNGGDTAYVPDVFISTIKELFTRKQGSQTPAEYDDQIGSCQVAIRCPIVLNVPCPNGTHGQDI